jgi:hypothetical protein
MTRATEVTRIDFPTLGDLADGWIKQHCRVPDGFAVGAEFELSDWQFFCVASHYRVREGIAFNPDPMKMLRSQAFVYRRSMIVAPQKTGKGPLAASITAFEAAGPALFAGWAKAGDAYRCDENGCSCGWYFDYQVGEPMGMRWPTPKIQLMAASEDQVDNTYGPLKNMVAMGPIGELMKVHESSIKVAPLPGAPDGAGMNRITPVTSSGLSRLGQPITFAIQDESGTYTKTNRLEKPANDQRRGLAGMSGRAIETTNAWDPTENSVAQQTWESGSEDLFRFYRNPDLEPSLRNDEGERLSYQDKRSRRKIHAYAYRGSPWVDLDAIEAEASEILQRDPAQAERFFGNRLVYGQGSWLPDGVWAGAYAGRR